MPNEITPAITDALSANVLDDVSVIESRAQTRFYNWNALSPSWQSPAPWLTTHFSFAGSVVVGTADGEWLVGGDGDDTIDGAGGADTMVGSKGNDTYIVDNVGDVVGENPGQGIDHVIASVSYTLGNNVENLTLTGGSAFIGRGNTLDNQIIGNALDNTLLGDAGDDTLDGGIGIDTMVGGIGNDVYYVDDINDFVLENAGGGIDTVFSSGEEYNLADNIENLTLTGSAIIGRGNDLDNLIIGNAEWNWLNGGAGADTLIGGAGNDTYYFVNLDDVVIENADEGYDTIVTTISYTLGDHIESLVLRGPGLAGTGNDLDNHLLNAMSTDGDYTTLDGGAGNDLIEGNGSYSVYIGGSGNDTIRGGSGHSLYVGGSGDDSIILFSSDNTLVGGSGDDFYYVSDLDHIIIENAGEGIDTVQAYGRSITLSDHVENLELYSPPSGFVAKGNDENNIIQVYHPDGSGTLDGAAGDDYLVAVVYAYVDHVLIGGSGVDTMSGGMGNDTYYVDNELDEAYEDSWFSGGYDTVISHANYTLLTAIEELQLQGSAISGTGNALDNKIVGNALANNLRGEAGNDTLDGGAGNDTMAGGSGDDTYYVNSTADRVTELASEGTDTIHASVSWTLGANMENLVLTGSATRGVGNALNNVIQGTSANNNLNGGSGSDTLTGGAGEDQFVLTRGHAGVDTITDFVHGTDQIVLSGFDFSSLEDEYTLVIDGGPVDEVATLLYNSTTGVLSFDEDGTGGAAAIQLALLSTKPVLTASDFILI
ncbi:calcium-binding protein [Microvirga sp. ACRRW]|uniref:calcium-binding protein n=1 Tax=Microvirga sp. ACRRW TaxID=2918205 RepID=UPI001EF6F7A2|nr:calcium-binding protein [Microvirga sp. ACRRW]MCG7391807.1 calcium-binding protein [Microvirga sp. ACRRW]